MVPQRALSRWLFPLRGGAQVRISPMWHALAQPYHCSAAAGWVGQANQQVCSGSTRRILERLPTRLRPFFECPGRQATTYSAAAYSVLRTKTQMIVCLQYGASPSTMETFDPLRCNRAFEVLPKISLHIYAMG